MMSLFFSLILSTFFSINPVNTAHEFHLSKCDINYSKTEESLQISINLFIDDLELALSSIGYDSLRICSENESKDAELIIHRFIKEHLIIIVDDNMVEMNWIGKEISEDFAAVWSYLEVPNVHPTESIVIQNDILMSTFSDQQNVVKLILSTDRKSFFLFNRKDFTGRLNLNK